jgi:uncharacterized protein YjbI with pentapeptide repeats
LKLRSPAGLTLIGVGATLLVTAAVVVVLLLFGGGAKAISGNAALIGALVALGSVFTTQMVNSALEAQRAQQALEVGDQRAQDDATQAYLDQMTDLLLDKERPLHQSEEGDEVSTLARARTLTTLSRLDGARKGNVVQFLYESNLITVGRLLVALIGADLREVELRGASLRGADLGGANLRGARLSDAELSETRLSKADLRGARLSDTNLSLANLSKANLGGARLISAELGGADLRGARLRGTQLRGADLRGADLRGTTEITNEDLERLAFSLEGATMPNGQKYEDWLKSRDSAQRPWWRRVFGG